MNMENGPGRSSYTEEQRTFIDQAVSNVLLSMRSVADFELNTPLRSDIEFPSYESFQYLPILAQEKGVDPDSIKQAIRIKVESFGIRDENEKLIMIRQGESIVDSIFEEYGKTNTPGTQTSTET